MTTSDIDYNEADTCRRLVTPQLVEAGWERPPHSITEQREFTDGRILVSGGKTCRADRKKADYILRSCRDFAIAMVEAKRLCEPAATGLQQVKQIVGRGTRVRDDYSKLSINFLDDTASATRLFADPDFDGDPVRVLNHADGDPFDLLCHVGFQARIRSRRERADRMRLEETAFFQQYTAKAREILLVLLDKYSEHGAEQFAFNEVLKSHRSRSTGTLSRSLDTLAVLPGSSRQLRSCRRCCTRRRTKNKGICNAWAN